MKYDVRMPLYEIRLSVDGRCNYNCIYCGPFADGKKALGYGTMSLEQIDKVSGLIKKNNLHVQITGGEPSVREDLDEIVLALSSKGVEDIGISTNGSNIDKEYLMKMVSCGLNEIHFHIPTLNQEAYEKVVGNTKKVDEIINLSLFSKERINVEYNTPITSLNIPTITDLLDFCWDNEINIKLIEEVSLSKDRIKEPEIEGVLDNWFNSRNISFKKTLREKKYGKIYETGRGVRFRIAPVTPNLIEHIKGKPQDILLDGRFWIGGKDREFIYTSSYFLNPSKGTFEDLEKELNNTLLIYNNIKDGIPDY
jgi:cyclic pyranopterin phosphate synthase